MSKKQAADSKAAEDDDVLAKGKEPGAKVSKGTKNKPENRMKKDPKEPRGVVYIGHLPTGFFEPQMREFLAQFGTVTRLRLSRSKKNAHSKGYAFVEFEDEEVAQIVAETMDKYLLFGRQLVAHVVDDKKRHPALFRGAGKKMKPLDRKRKALQKLQHNKKRGDDRKDDDPSAAVPAVTRRQQSRRLQKQERKRGVLKGMGISYDFEGWDETPASKKAKAKSGSSGAAPETKKAKDVHSSFVGKRKRPSSADALVPSGVKKAKKKA